jgi:hypothetical protein
VLVFSPTDQTPSYLLSRCVLVFGVLVLASWILETCDTHETSKDKDT